MENVLLTILFMAIVGAAIGGFTNYLAIKMLFRPYNPLYIGKWKLPFTPGLIPKRRAELAKQIGLTVKNYLLTPEVFRKKLLNSSIQNNVLEYAQEKADNLVFTEDKTIMDWLKKGGFEQLPQTIEGRVDAVIEKQFNSIKNTISTKSIEELLPDSIKQSIENKIPEAVNYLLNKGEEYFLSPKGEVTIKSMMDDFLGSKGSLGGMISMFLGDSNSLVLKIQKELIKLLQAPGTNKLLVNIFTQEWDKMKQQPAINYLGEVDFDTLLSNIQNYAKKEMNITEHLNKPISYYWPQGSEYVKNELLPLLIDSGFKELENKLEDMVNRLKIEEVVQEQVDSFPLEKLEELVVGIARKELKMITILGAVLGGIIGIVQGLIVYILN